MPKLKIQYLQEAKDFIMAQPSAVRKKITYNAQMVMEGSMDKDLFKKLTKDIWELRTKYNGQEYRLLAFWDTREGTWVVATHGFSKKTQKTPPKEIAHAEAIRKDYLNKK